MGLLELQKSFCEALKGIEDLWAHDDAYEKCHNGTLQDADDLFDQDFQIPPALCLNREKKAGAKVPKARYSVPHSLSEAVFYDVQEKCQPCTEEARFLLEAEGFGTESVERIEQAKRAILLLELRQFVRKAELFFANLQFRGDGDQVDRMMRHLKKILYAHNPAFITVDDLYWLQEIVIDDIGALVTCDSLSIGEKWPEYQKLKSEFEAHFNELAEL